MRFSKPAWVTHQDQGSDKRVTLYSCHVHPDGSRLATGGLDAKIRIWSTLPILNPQADQPNLPKKLCTLTMHSGPVLCVRWSNSGKWLASGSDDAVVMIWDLDPHGSGRVWGNDEPNIEGWKALKRLPGHDSDVADLAWHPKDRYLASVGLDSKVIIWCGYTLEPLRKLDRHGGFVKGVIWDPVGEFLATQSDDKSCIIWRTTDWEVEATVTKPFQDSPGSTFFRRLSWSPDGAHITASNALNNNGYVFVAAVIARNDWTSDICLVGHENTVEVASYNPHIFLRDPTGDVTSTNICSVVALGADDLSLSIWQTKSPRPLIVAKDAFDAQIYDLSWSQDGLTLYACSADGSLGAFDFDPSELDGIVSLEAKEVYLQRFGFHPPPETTSTLVPKPIAGAPPSSLTPNGIGGQLSAQAQAAAAAAMDPGPAYDKKGRRRIKPVFVAALSTAPSAAPGTYTSSAAPVPYAPSMSGFASTQPIQPPAPYPMPSSSIPSTSVYHTPAQQPSQVFHPAPTHLSPTTPHHHDMNFSQTDFERNHRPPPSFANHRGSINGFDTDGDAQMGAPPISAVDTTAPGKRKASDMTVGGGDDSGSAGKSLKARTLGGDKPREPLGPVRELRTGAAIYLGPIGTGSRLDVPPLKTSLSEKSEEKEGDVFEARNFEDGKPTELTFISGKQTQFLDYPSAPVLSLSVTGAFCAAALVDGSLNVYSLTGRRLFPTLALDSPCAYVEGAKWFLMAITASAKLHVWNVKTCRAAFPTVSLGTILNPNSPISSATIRPNGAPVIVLSNGVAYTYDTDLACLAKLSEHRWSAGSDAWEGRQRHNKAVANKGVVATLESTLSELEGGGVAMPAERPPWWDAAYTLGHLETRQHAARALESPAEYKAALSLYAKRIADEGFRAKAEELIKELCGPLYWKPGREEAWSPNVLGMVKRDLLREVLSTFGAFVCRQDLI
ncbi:HIR complex subunit [Tulasnella sp. JGI-2019a]|nr:HIR complex subunit [Tulasnella sp. JGI-2019a]